MCAYVRIQEKQAVIVIIKCYSTGNRKWLHLIGQKTYHLLTTFPRTGGCNKLSLELQIVTKCLEIAK